MDGQKIKLHVVNPGLAISAYIASRSTLAAYRRVGSSSILFYFILFLLPRSVSPTMESPLNTVNTTLLLFCAFQKLKETFAGIPGTPACPE